MHFNSNFNILSALGLILDFLGVILLLKYGLPSKIEQIEGDSLISPMDEQTVIKIKEKNKEIIKGAE